MIQQEIDANVGLQNRLEWLEKRNGILEVTCQGQQKYVQLPKFYFLLRWRGCGLKFLIPWSRSIKERDEIIQHQQYLMEASKTDSGQLLREIK
jgi:hypothetical protein